MNSKALTKATPETIMHVDLWHNGRVVERGESVKFGIDQADFRAAIVAAARAVPSRSTHPILGNLLVVADGDRVTVTGSDLGTRITVAAGATVEEAGAYCYPAKLLADMIGKLSPGIVTIDDELISAGRGKYSVKGSDVSEYPSLPDVAGEALILPPDAILDGLAGTLPCASVDESKGILCGVHVTLRAGLLEMASTDGHRLGIVATDVDGDRSVEVTLPSKTLLEVQRCIMSAKPRAVELLLDEQQLSLAIGNTTIVGRVLEGNFPNYPQLIPQTFKVCATVNRKIFVDSLQRVAVIANQGSNVVKLGIANDAIAIEAESEPGTALETIETESNGEINIAFNVDYLITAVKALPAESVAIHINSPNSPVTITPVGVNGHTHLLMPVQVRQ